MYYISGESKSFAAPSIKEMGVRLVCAFILHLLIIPEVKTSLMMMNYLTRLRPSKQASLSFTSRNLCFAIACMKVTSALFCSYVNLLVICQSDTTTLHIMPRRASLWSNRSEQKDIA